MEELVSKPEIYREYKIGQLGNEFLHFTTASFCISGKGFLIGKSPTFIS